MVEAAAAAALEFAKAGTEISLSFIRKSLSAEGNLLSCSLVNASNHTLSLVGQFYPHGKLC